VFFVIEANMSGSYLSQPQDSILRARHPETGPPATHHSLTKRPYTHSWRGGHKPALSLLERFNPFHRLGDIAIMQTKKTYKQDIPARHPARGGLLYSGRRCLHAALVGRGRGK
jgi:hypothetical protein